MRRRLWLNLAVLAVIIGTSLAAVQQQNDKVAFDQELNTIPDEDEQSLKDILKRNPKLALADDFRFNKMLKPRPAVVATTNEPTTEDTFELDASHSEVTKSDGKTSHKELEDDYTDDMDDDDYYYDDTNNSTDFNSDLDLVEKKNNKAEIKLKPIKGDDSLPPPTTSSSTVPPSSTSNAPAMTESSSVTPTPTQNKKKVASEIEDNENNLESDYEDDEDLDDDLNGESVDEEAYDDDEEDNAEDYDADMPCPRDCVCHLSQSDTMIATCSRLDLEVQKFSSAVTDLEVVNIEPKYPIILGENFFTKIGLKRVVTIKITNCTVESIAPTAFNGLTDLFLLNLTNTGLDMVHPDTFVNNTRLKILILSGNNLSAMQDTPSPFTNYMLNAPSVEEFSISNCNLSRLLPTAFDKLKRIVYINLADNDIETLPETLFNNANTIEELDLSFNSIKSLPKGIFTQTALAMLHMKYNRVAHSLDFLTADLQKLDLSYNKITAISGGMFKSLIGLQSLELKGNDITKIHQAAFLSLRNLRNIDLSFTKLDQIPSLLFLKNKELDVIKLNDNPNLKDLPAEGFISENGSFSVYHLDLSMCDIVTLGDDTFKSMPYLSRLNLGWNNLAYLNDQVFRHLHKLKDLDLTNNILENMHDNVFAQNYELSKLSLAGNNFLELNPSTFAALSKLEDLDLSDCDFTRLWAKKVKPNTFPSLKYLNVSNNVIVKLSPADFNHMPKLMVLDVSENMLTCSDDFKSLMTWVVKKSIAHGDGSVDQKTHAELRKTIKNREKVQKSWQSLAFKVCSEAKADEEDSESNPLPSEETDEKDYEDYINEFTEDKEDNGDMIVDGGLKVSEVEKKRTKNPLAEDDSFERIFDELEKEAAINNNHSDFLASYSTIAIFSLSCMTLVLVIVHIASRMLDKRHERYRQAILANKNSIVYQKLSEEINGGQGKGKLASTPKVHHYQPIQQV